MRVGHFARAEADGGQFGGLKRYGGVRSSIQARKAVWRDGHDAEIIIMNLGGGTRLVVFASVVLWDPRHINYYHTRLICLTICPGHDACKSP